jgi:hypothetical protein
MSAKVFVSRGFTYGMALMWFATVLSTIAAARNLACYTTDWSNISGLVKERSLAET